MFCVKCGNNLTPGAEFCSKCGAKINQQSATADSGTTPVPPNAAEKMVEQSAEKWKELAPKAKEAAAAAAEKASVLSKDILGELKQSGVVFRQAIDENKGNNTESKAKLVENIAKSFIGMLSERQKVILASASGLVVILMFSLVGWNIAPPPNCIGAGIDLLQQAGFTENPNQNACEFINAIFVASTNNTCSPSKTYRYIANNAEHIINNSVLAGLSDRDKKNEALKFSKSAKAFVSNCKLN